MFEWKVEEMALMHENCKFYIGNQRIYHCEKTTSREDKIAFVDSFTDGKLSYLLGLIEKFEKDKKKMPKDDWGDVKTVSLKAWIKRSDTKYSSPIIDDWNRYGRYHILNIERYIQSNQKGHYEYYDDLVDEAFHRQLENCEQEEIAYFKAHDEYEILRAKIDKKCNQYRTSFGVKLLFSSSDGILIHNDNEDYRQRKERKPTIDELKYLSEQYDRLDMLVDEITENTNIFY